MRIRSYSELITLPTLEERFRYLALGGSVGESTFGFDRWLNQQFYRSREWQDARQYVIARDNGCDLAVRGHTIHERIYIHHMNPLTAEQLVDGDRAISDPEYLISCTHRTHNAIHYGDERLLPQQFEPRRPGDTTLW